jgi:predicted DCC family thiol-disulfide oxidoreductase YuxK
VRLAPGFVAETQLTGDERIVTFADGFSVAERLVDIDDTRLRLAYAAHGGRSTHHNATIQVIDLPPGTCRLVWITDFLPDELRDHIAAMMDRGLNIMKRTLEDMADPEGGSS